MDLIDLHDDVKAGRISDQSIEVMNASLPAMMAQRYNELDQALARMPDYDADSSNALSPDFSPENQADHEKWLGSKRSDLSEYASSLGVDTGLGFNKEREHAIDEGVSAEVTRLRSEGFSKAHISENSFEIEDEVRKRIENYPELVNLPPDDRREFEALERQISETDFNYESFDDRDGRAVGQAQVEVAKNELDAFASKSDIHFALASRAWDNAQERSNALTGVSDNHSMEIDITQHPADIRDALNIWAESNAAKIAQLKPEDRKEVTDQLYKTLDHIESVLDKDYQVQWTDGRPQGSVFIEPYANVVVGDEDLLRKRAAAYLPEGSDVSRLAELEENGGLHKYVMTGQTETGFEAETRAWEAAYADYGSGSLTDGRETMQQIRAAVAETGIDPDTFEEQLMIGASGARQEEEWAVSDIEAVVADRGLDGTQDEDIAQAVSVVSGLHQYVSDRLDDLYSRHYEYSREAFEATSQTILREMETFRTTSFESPAAEQDYLRMFRAEFGAASLGQMADGDLSMLEGLTKDPAEQRSIAHVVLELEAKHHQIGVAQETLERGLELHNPASGHELDGHSRIGKGKSALWKWP